MPQLILFAACEKVIIDADGLASLITLIEKVQVAVPAGVDLSKPIAVPMRWAVLAVWQLAEQEWRQFEQKIELVSADKNLVAMHTEPQILEPTSRSATGCKMISHLTAIPLNQGPLELRLYLHRVNDPKWEESATYPVEVILQRQ